MLIVLPSPSSRMYLFSPSPLFLLLYYTLRSTILLYTLLYSTCLLFNPSLLPSLPIPIHTPLSLTKQQPTSQSLLLSPPPSSSRLHPLSSFFYSSYLSSIFQRKKERSESRAIRTPIPINTRHLPRSSIVAALSPHHSSIPRYSTPIQYTQR